MREGLVLVGSRGVGHSIDADTAASPTSSTPVARTLHRDVDAASTRPAVARKATVGTGPHRSGRTCSAHTLTT
jgi:hypothetical protein